MDKFRKKNTFVVASLHSVIWKLICIESFNNSWLVGKISVCDGYFCYLMAFFMCWKSPHNLVRICVLCQVHISCLLRFVCNDCVKKFSVNDTLAGASSEIDVKFVQISITDVE